MLIQVGHFVLFPLESSINNELFSCNGLFGFGAEGAWDTL
jgi:hypothetical protein